jgi:phosphate:Na+ symporter
MNVSVLTDMFFMVLGGLGIFLLGMHNMSNGIQAIAGNKMRQLINAITNNRIMAIIVGFFVTAIIQSSSVTSVMVVGFVNAELMTLTQALGVILGADIGTTVTGWILVLKIGKYGLPILGEEGLLYIF